MTSDELRSDVKNTLNYYKYGEINLDEAIKRIMDSVFAILGAERTKTLEDWYKLGYKLRIADQRTEEEGYLPLNCKIVMMKTPPVRGN